MTRVLYNLQNVDMKWCWTSTQNDFNDAVNDILLQAPVVALPDPAWTFSVICDVLNIYPLAAHYCKMTLMPMIVFMRIRHAS